MGGTSMWERLIDFLRRISVPRIVEPGDESRVKDEAWFKQLTAKDGVDYSGAEDYAEHKYAEACSVHDAIDKKAEWAFGIGLAFASAGAAGLKSSGWYIVLSLPAFLAIAYSMMISMWVRLPGERDSIMTTKDALKVYENEDNPTLVMTAARHSATAALIRLIEWKSRQLTKAALALIAGGILLLIPLVVISVSASERTVPSEFPNSHYESVQSDSGARTEHLEWKWESTPGRPPAQPAQKK
jgi:hypothetical protein